MTQYGTWVSYTGAARPELAAALLAAAAALTYAGIRLPLPAGPARPGQKATVFMLVAWVVAITAFLACVVVYIQQLRREGLAHGLPPDHIFPITFIAAGVTFFIIVTKSPRAAGPRSPAPSSPRWPGRWSSSSPSTSS